MPLAIHFETADRFEHGRPLHIVVRRTHVAHRGEQDEVLDVQDARGLVGALQQRAQADELPRLVVTHGDVQYAVDQVTAHANLVAEGRQVRGFAPAAFRREQQVEAVDLLPHFRRDGLPYAARIFPGGQDARIDRTGILRVESQEAHHVLAGGAAVAFQKHRAVAGDVHDRLPLAGEFLRQIERQVVVNVQKSNHIFGAFDVAAQPVYGIGHPAQKGISVRHDYCCWPPLPAAAGASSTHVSLLPPPCEELTTSEPLRMATRVSPPGST